jgi:non-ribosomal peptide synthetase component F
MEKAQTPKRDGLRVHFDRAVDLLEQKAALADAPEKYQQVLTPHREQAHLEVLRQLERKYSVNAPYGGA